MHVVVHFLFFEHGAPMFWRSFEVFIFLTQNTIAWYPIQKTLDALPLICLSVISIDTMVYQNYEDRCVKLFRQMSNCRKTITNEGQGI